MGLLKGTVLVTVVIVAAFTDGFVLHDNVKVISVKDGYKTGELLYNVWQPNEEERKVSDNILTNPEASRYQDFVRKADGSNIRADYRVNPLSTNLTYSLHDANDAPMDLVVELLLICDKEWGDKFQHDRARILDYWTVYFWDLNMRYKTLPSVNLSFRITGVVVIATTEGQPFIEGARAEDGRAEFGRILDRFTPWVAENKGNFPMFDMAVAVTNTALEWGGGLAWMNHACLGQGSLVFNDGGDWGSVTIGTHEIAHSLGAPHDESVEGCTASGYIMSGGNDELRYFFSWCSDDTITRFVTSDQASCLRQIDEASVNPISPDFSAVKAPTAEEQCVKHFGPEAWMEEADKSNCKSLRCVFPREEGGWWISWIAAVENTVCSSSGGRCFQGICREPDNLIQNVGSGQCLKAPNHFAFTVNVEMVDCPRPGTPLDRFAISNLGIGKTLGTPWQNFDATEHGDRCIYTGNSEGNGLATDRCDPGNPWHGWDFQDVGNGEFLLQHRETKRCAKQEGNGIATYSNCDSNDQSMRWKLN